MLAHTESADAACHGVIIYNHLGYSNLFQKRKGLDISTVETLDLPLRGQATPGDLTKLQPVPPPPRRQQQDQKTMGASANIATVSSKRKYFYITVHYTSLHSCITYHTLI